VSGPAAEDIPDVRVVDAAALRAWPLPQPGEDGDKEARGRVVVVAGARTMPGAAWLAATAALRAGCGKVVVLTAASVAPGLALALPEAKVVGLPDTDGGGFAGDDAADGAVARALDDAVDADTGAVLVGPGMEDARAACACVRAVRRRAAAHGVPVVLDAIALQALEGAPSAARHPLVVTPHAGEMARLSGLSKEAVCADPRAVARATAARHGAVVALKGATTWIAAPDGRTFRHDGGSIGLATAGSGDVLAGVVAGLLARGAEPAQAMAWGSALHAEAGRVLAERIGPLGFLARELPAEVPGALARWLPAPVSP
jgi:ADP-dependent NAD(P)H-hydrate dehydratase